MTPFPDLSSQLSAAMPKLRGRMTANQSMADLTWFRAGGLAQLLFSPADEDDLAYFLQKLAADIPVTVVGVGSNLIVRDGGIEGVVIRLSPRGFGRAEFVGENKLSAGCATPDKKVAEVAAEAGLGGMEFYFGIPGWIGGALRMNAGANGGETKDVLVYANAVDRQGDMHTLSLAEMGFTYRYCAAPADLVFTSALFEGKPEDKAVIRQRMAAVQEHRETAQPIREKTGGSTFKNPPGHSAWKLIDAAGCRGLRVGGAMMSEMHCNFMINTGAATAADLESLGEEVRRRVQDHSGISLQWEIKRLGKIAGPLAA